MNSPGFKALAAEAERPLSEKQAEALLKRMEAEVGLSDAELTASASASDSAETRDPEAGMRRLLQRADAAAFAGSAALRKALSPVDSGNDADVPPSSRRNSDRGAASAAPVAGAASRREERARALFASVVRDSAAARSPRGDRSGTSGSDSASEDSSDFDIDTRGLQLNRSGVVPPAIPSPTAQRLPRLLRRAEAAAAASERSGATAAAAAGRAGRAEAAAAASGGAAGLARRAAVDALEAALGASAGGGIADFAPSPAAGSAPGSVSWGSFQQLNVSFDASSSPPLRETVSSGAAVRRGPSSRGSRSAASALTVPRKAGQAAAGGSSGRSGGGLLREVEPWGDTSASSDDSDAVTAWDVSVAAEAAGGGAAAGKRGGGHRAAAAASLGQRASVFSSDGEVAGVASEDIVEADSSSASDGGPLLEAVSGSDGDPDAAFCFSDDASSDGGKAISAAADAAAALGPGKDAAAPAALMSEAAIDAHSAAARAAATARVQAAAVAARAQRAAVVAQLLGVPAEDPLVRAVLRRAYAQASGEGQRKWSRIADRLQQGQGQGNLPAPATATVSEASGAAAGLLQSEQKPAPATTAGELLTEARGYAAVMLAADASFADTVRRRKAAAEAAARALESSSSSASSDSDAAPPMPRLAAGNATDAAPSPAVADSSEEAEAAAPEARGRGRRLSRARLLAASSRSAAAASSTAAGGEGASGAAASSSSAVAALSERQQQLAAIEAAEEAAVELARLRTPPDGSTFADMQRHDEFAGGGAPPDGAFPNIPARYAPDAAHMDPANAPPVARRMADAVATLRRRSAVLEGQTAIARVAALLPAPLRDGLMALVSARARAVADASPEEAAASMHALDPAAPVSLPTPHQQHGQQGQQGHQPSPSATPPPGATTAGGGSGRGPGAAEFWPRIVVGGGGGSSRRSGGAEALLAPGGGSDDDAPRHRRALIGSGDGSGIIGSGGALSARPTADGSSSVAAVARAARAAEADRWQARAAAEAEALVRELGYSGLVQPGRGQAVRSDITTGLTATRGRPGLRGPNPRLPLYTDPLMAQWDAQRRAGRNDRAATEYSAAVHAARLEELHAAGDEDALAAYLVAQGEVDAPTDTVVAGGVGAADDGDGGGDPAAASAALQARVALATLTAPADAEQVKETAGLTRAGPGTALLAAVDAAAGRGKPTRVSLLPPGYRTWTEVANERALNPKRAARAAAVLAAERTAVLRRGITPARDSSTGAEPTRRQARVAFNIRRVVQGILSRRALKGEPGLYPGGVPIEVAEVSVTADLRIAYVRWMLPFPVALLARQGEGGGGGLDSLAPATHALLRTSLRGGPVSPAAARLIAAIESAGHGDRGVARLRRAASAARAAGDAGAAAGSAYGSGGKRSTRGQLTREFYGDARETGHLSPALAARAAAATASLARCGNAALRRLVGAELGMQFMPALQWHRCVGAELEQAEAGPIARMHDWRAQQQQQLRPRLPLLGDDDNGGDEPGDDGTAGASSSDGERRDEAPAVGRQRPSSRRRTAARLG